MEEYFISLIMPPAEERRLNSWRQKFYSSSVERHPPHITIIPPFKTDEIGKIIEQIENLVKEIPSFYINYQGTGIFPNQEKIFYVKIKRTSELENLHRELAKIANFPTKHSFNPHISIAKSKSGELSKVEGYFKNISLDQSFPAREIILFKGHRGGHWEKFKTFTLK